MIFMYFLGMTNAMRLLYDDTELQDIYSLGFYNIHDDCDLQLLFQPDAFINVTIQLLRKQVIKSVGQGLNLRIVIWRQISQTFNAESECSDHPFLENWYCGEDPWSGLGVAIDILAQIQTPGNPFRFAQK